MRIDELRQALESHYRHEGQTLLSADGSFPYSNKDIELVCGSLVTVRNGTLQVVHLTVKQYIKSLSGPTSLRLLAETKGANLRLTLACLTLVRHNCLEPIAKLFPLRPIGAEEEKPDLSLLRSKNPFLEYACFSWMIHLTDCTSMEALEVFRSVHCTFDSPATFGWIESCMALQPQDVPRLLIGLEEVRDWIDSLQIGTVIADDLSYTFALKWCTTMEQVLKEYSPVLEERTADIYYLDLATIFAAHGLTETYKKHGGVIRRERCSRFSTDRNPRPARKNIPLCRQLQMPSKTEIYGLGFFIYESNRDIYLSGLQKQPTLFAQSASSGKRLLPLSDPEARDLYHLLSYEISGDGNHLGVVYISDSEGQRLSIAIWEIEATLDFTKRTQAHPWARIVHRSTFVGENTVPRWFKPCIVFDWDGVCITPNGLVRTAQGANSFIPGNPLLRLSEEMNVQYSDIRRAFYSQNGKFLFILSSGKITKYSLHDLGVQFELSLSDGNRNVQMASPSGRYLIFFTPSENSFFLFIDTILDKTVFLPRWAGPEQELLGYEFRFSVDEREVVACYQIKESGFLAVVVHCYVGLPSDVRLRTSGKCVCDPVKVSVGFSLSDDQRTARLVTQSREIVRIKLGNEIEFLDAPDTSNEYPIKSVFLSRDGSRWASVDYGKGKARLQTYTMLNPSETPQGFELQRESSLGNDRSGFIRMSLDLSILVVDGDVYSLRDSKMGGLPMTQQTLKLPRELKARQSPWNDRPPQCSVDSSNSFVVYHTQNRDYETGANSPDIFALFRINIDDSSSSQLQPSLPEGMFGISSQFHPSAPLLILGFGLISEASAILSRDDVSDDDQTPLHVVMINTETMSTHTVEVEQSPDLFFIYGLETY